MFTIWVTGMCNMKCRYCYEGDEKKKENMNCSTADKVIQWILKEISNDHKTHYIRFHGGEPTLNIDIIKYIVTNLKYSGYTFVYLLTTNGYRVNEKIAEFLAENISMISVSIDGNKKSNDMKRINEKGNSTFEQVIKNAKYINKLTPNMLIRMTISPETCEDLFDNISYLLEQGFHNIDAEIDVFNNRWSAKKLTILENKCKKIVQEISKQDGKVNINLPICYPERRLEPCVGGIEEFSIDTSGNIFPCIYAVGDSELCIGNVEDGIDKQKQKQIKKINLSTIKACIGCGGYESCLSVRCKIVNKYLMGSFQIPNLLICELHRRNINWILNSDDSYTLKEED